jgi:hypothetical protein
MRSDEDLLDELRLQDPTVQSLKSRKDTVGDGLEASLWYKLEKSAQFTYGYEALRDKVP